MKKREKIYRRRLERFQWILGNINRLYNRVSVSRSVIFFLGVVALFWLRSASSPMITYTVCGLFLVAFLALVKIHERVSRYREKIRAAIKINKESIERLNDRWSEFSKDGYEYCKTDSPYMTDLGIFGKNSLFQMIQQTATKRGDDILAELLSQCRDFFSLTNRQDGVREIAPLLSFRHRLLLEGRNVSPLIGPGDLLKWSRTSSFLVDKRWLLFLRKFLLISSFSLFVHYLVFDSSLFLFPLGAQILLFVLTAKKCQEKYKRALFAESSFLAYSGMFLSIEKMSFKSPYLVELQENLTTRKTPLSLKMKELEKINHQLSICFSIIHPFLNTLFLWDLHYLYKQESWKEEMKPCLEVCFDVLGTFEALSSLAGFAFDNPGYSYPSVDERNPPFEAVTLGHPLISEKERVCNDVTVRSEGEVMLITGSNMSGKSTFIRTVGINMILAFSGAPVAALRLDTRPCKIMTCIQVLDSLKLHLSHFYAEVQEIKSILDSVFLEDPPLTELPVFYLIDEIFSGTNTRERLLASRGIIMKLTKSRSYGLLTTHDLDLTILENESPMVVNHHFQDDVTEEGDMVFDYKIKEGPVTSTNALKVIALAGITLDDL